MFAYCNNNPVNGYDPTGAMMCCAATCQEPGRLLDYIIYYYHPESSLNMDDIAKRQSYSSLSISKAVSSYEELINALNDSPRGVNNVFLYLHSEVTTNEEAYFVFYYAKYYNKDDITEDFPKIDIRGDIYLFSCHGAFLAPYIAESTDHNVIATKYSVNNGSRTSSG